MSRLTAVYRIKGDARTIEQRARSIAVEQSVEMPVEGIDDPAVLGDIVGKVETIADLGDGLFEVRIALAVSTTGPEPGQLLNMLFGNSSIHEDVTLWDAELPEAVLRAFSGPNRGIDGLRQRCGAKGRAMTCSALKPQGLPPAKLAAIAARLAEGGIDFIKDDHGLADQSYSPFAQRVAAVQAALRRTGTRACYAPSVTGSLDQMRTQVGQAVDQGVDCVLVTPMICGLANFQALVKAHPKLGFMTHPAMAGAARIAPPFLLGTLFRLLGSDATVFPTHGGRFGYSPETCRALADRSRRPLAGRRPAVPVPAGGMTTERVREMLSFYGTDTMLLIGGNLLQARERLAEAAAAFTKEVAAAG